MESFKVYPTGPLYDIGVCCKDSVFIPDFIDMDLISPLLSSLIRRLINLIYLFNEATLCSIDYICIVLFVFIMLFSTLNFIISFYIKNWGLVCSCFSET